MTNIGEPGANREPTVSAETILATVATPVAVLDRQEVIRDVNPALAQLVGQSRDQVVGQRWAALVSGDAPPSEGQAMIGRDFDPACPGNVPGSAYVQVVVDASGQPHPLWWTDAAGPHDTVIRVGMEIPDAYRDESVDAERDDGRVLAAAKRLVQEAETLRQASAVVLQSLDLSEAIRRILEQLAKVIPYDSASVQLLRDGELEIVGGRGWDDPEAVIGMRFPIPGDNPNTEIVQERTPVVLHNAPEAYSEFRKPPHDHIRSFLGVPLIVHDRLIGVLAVDSRQPAHFTDDHVRVATAFADQVAIAIENARLYEDVQKLSLTDPLTGLHNRRGLIELGQRELDRARRFDHALSVLMLDLDRFKTINDAHGHGVGDEVLIEIAHRCQHSVREVDILSRYGGEEFVAMLPETGLADAQRIADRLRGAVERHPIDSEAGPLRVTISVGVAVWHASLADLDGLLTAADGALYDAKSAGRNQVRTAPAAS